MSRKNEYNYFEQFVKLSKFSLDCAEALNKTLHEFDKNTFEKKVKEMHEIEHEADLAKHEVLNRLIKEFLPPIEREDINSLSQKIDDVTDAVEDVVIKIDMFNIQSIPQDILKFSNLIVKCCTAMNEALEEFQNFKKSTTLTKKIIEINTLEEEGDALYYNTVRNLFQTSKDPVELLVWTQILHRFELCYDCCEDVANLIETVIMKNS